MLASSGPGKALQREQQVWTSHQGWCLEREGRASREDWELPGPGQGTLGSRHEGCAWKPSTTPIGFSRKATGSRAHIPGSLNPEWEG